MDGWMEVTCNVECFLSGSASVSMTQSEMTRVTHCVLPCSMRQRFHGHDTGIDLEKSTSAGMKVLLGTAVINYSSYPPFTCPTPAPLPSNSLAQAALEIKSLVEGCDLS